MTISTTMFLSVKTNLMLCWMLIVVGHGKLLATAAINMCNKKMRIKVGESQIRNDASNQKLFLTV